MPRIANPRATIPDGAPAEPRRPIPVPHKSDVEDSDPVDPLAPGSSLFDEDDDAVEPNEPA
jgi:hypothetical protein